MYQTFKQNELPTKKINDMRTTNYLIIDTTSNGGIYIDSDGQNCNLEENAAVYSTEEEAQDRIDRNGWNDWAATMETDEEVNQ